MKPKNKTEYFVESPSFQAHKPNTPTQVSNNQIK